MANLNMAVRFALRAMVWQAEINMEDEPELSEINGDESAPATRGDVNELAHMVSKSFEAERKRTDEGVVRLETLMDGLERQMGNLEGRMDGLETRMGSLEGTMQTVLKIVETIDERTKGWEDLPARVQKLEEDVFRLQSRSCS